MQGRDLWDTTLKYHPTPHSPSQVITTRKNSHSDHCSERAYIMVTTASPLRSLAARLVTQVPPPFQTYNRTILGVVRLQLPGSSRFHHLCPLSRRHHQPSASSAATFDFRRALSASSGYNRFPRLETRNPSRHKDDEEVDSEISTGRAALGLAKKSEEDRHSQLQATDSSQMTPQSRGFRSACLQCLFLIIPHLSFAFIFAFTWGPLVATLQNEENIQRLALAV